MLIDTPEKDNLLQLQTKKNQFLKKHQKQKSGFALHFLSPILTVVLMRSGWYNGYLKRSHLACDEDLNTYFCDKCDSEIYDWANPAVKKTVLTFLDNGQILHFLYLILMSMTRLCVISLSLLFLLLFSSNCIYI